ICIPVFFSLLPPPPTSTLFPYTTLFRSHYRVPQQLLPERVGDDGGGYGLRYDARRVRSFAIARIDHPDAGDHRAHPVDHHVDGRSEEHTSELQSRENLVCRLLLEKKNIK